MTKTKIFISILWVILTIAICYNSYNLASETKKINDVVNMFLLMLGGYGVIFTIASSTEALLEKMKNDKIENTYQLLKDWDDEHLFKARKLTREIKDQKNELSDNALVEKIEKDAELRQSVILVFNYIEYIRFSIKQDRICTDLFKESMKDTIIDIIKRFEAYSKRLSQQTHDDMQECRKLLEL